MARMSPGREMKKFMDDPNKEGDDPEMDMKAKSSKRKIPTPNPMASKVNMSDQENRAAKVAKMMMGSKKMGNNNGSDSGY